MLHSSKIFNNGHDHGILVTADHLVIVVDRLLQEVIINVDMIRRPVGRKEVIIFVLSIFTVEMGVVIVIIIIFRNHVLELLKIGLVQL